jgi:hypothetical protein
MLCSLEYRMMDKVQYPSNPACYTPSSEPSEGQTYSVSTTDFAEKRTVALDMTDFEDKYYFEERQLNN